MTSIEPRAVLSTLDLGRQEHKVTVLRRDKVCGYHSTISLLFKISNITF